MEIVGSSAQKAHVTPAAVVNAAPSLQGLAGSAARAWESAGSTVPPERVTGLLSASPLPAGRVASLSMLSTQGSPVLGLKPLVKTQSPPGSLLSWVALPPATLTDHTRFLVSTTRRVSARVGSNAHPIGSTVVLAGPLADVDDRRRAVGQ